MSAALGRLIFGLGSLLLLAWIGYIALRASNEEAYQPGLSDAKVQAQAAQLESLNTTIAAASELVTAANTASAAIRNSVTQRQAYDRKTSQELSDVLTATASLRAGCQFDAGVMQRLNTARDRAASAAASGITPAMP